MIDNYTIYPDICCKTVLPNHPPYTDE